MPTLSSGSSRSRRDLLAAAAEEAEAREWDQLEEHFEPVYWEQRGGSGGGGLGGGGGSVGRRRLLSDPVKLGHVIDRERACMQRLEDVGIIRMMP